MTQWVDSRELSINLAVVYLLWLKYGLINKTTFCREIVLNQRESKLNTKNKKTILSDLELTVLINILC